MTLSENQKSKREENRRAERDHIPNPERCTKGSFAGCARRFEDGYMVISLPLEILRSLQQPEEKS